MTNHVISPSFGNISPQFTIYLIFLRCGWLNLELIFLSLILLVSLRAVSILCSSASVGRYIKTRVLSRHGLTFFSFQLLLSHFSRDLCLACLILLLETREALCMFDPVNEHFPQMLVYFSCIYTRIFGFCWLFWENSLAYLILSKQKTI